MPSRKHVLTVAVGDPLEPTQWLVARLGLDRAAAASLVENGAVRVGTERARANQKLTIGARVVVRIEALSQPSGKARDSDDPQANGAIRIVYEDADLLIVDKPAGMLSQPSPGEHGTALDVQLARRYPGIHLVHRLDREASGLLVLTRNAAAHAAMQQALLDGKLARRYHAVAGGHYAGGTIQLRIARDPHDLRRRQALPERAPGGQPARTIAEVIRFGTLAGIVAGSVAGTVAGSVVEGGDDRKVAPVTLLAVTLDTGRTHQIRVHLAAVGHPLVGDRLYGGMPFARLLLHASSLSLPHPSTRSPLHFTSPPPAVMSLDGA